MTRVHVVENQQARRMCFFTITLMSRCILIMLKLQ